MFPPQFRGLFEVLSSVFEPFRSEIKKAAEQQKNAIADASQATEKEVGKIPGVVASAIEASHLDLKAYIDSQDEKENANRELDGKFQRKMLRATWATAIFTAFAFGAAAYYAHIARVQLDQTIEATKAATQAANVAQDTFISTYEYGGAVDQQLREMRRQTGAQVRATRAAEIAANTATDTLVVQNRPWLSAEAVLSGASSMPNNGDLTFDGRGNLSLTVTIKGKNFGRSIAQDIHVWAKLFTKRSGDPWEMIPKWQSQLCDKPPNVEVRPGVQFFQGFDRFPDQEYVDQTTSEIAAKDVMNESSFYSDDPTGRRFLSTIYLVGCVDYRFSFAKERHQTRFAYQL